MLYGKFQGVFLLVLMLSMPVLAEDDPDHIFLSISPYDEQCGTPKTSAVERNHAIFTERLQRTSMWLDEFFGDDRDQESLAHSSLRLSLDGDYVEAETGDTRVRLRGKIDLPRVAKRLQLVFEGEPENDDISGLENADSTASLRYKFKDTLLRETSLSLGMRGGLNDPRLFLRARSSQSKKRNNTLLRMVPSVGYDFTNGWEADFRVDVEYSLSNRDYFRMTSRPQWEEENSGIVFQQDFSYFHRFSRRNYLAADWLTTVPNSPSVTLDTTRYRLRYRRNIWQEKLFVEIAPGIRFTETNNYEMQWELGTRLELVFEP